MTEPVDQYIDSLSLDDARAEVRRLTEALRDSNELRRANDERYAADLAQLQQQVSQQDDIDRVKAERNIAQQHLTEVVQERDRLRGLVQETMAFVSTWVPDLTPVPSPPPDLEPSVAQAWVNTQIAARRAEWDSFVSRVTTQATV